MIHACGVEHRCVSSYSACVSFSSVRYRQRVVPISEIARPVICAPFHGAASIALSIISATSTTGMCVALFGWRMYAVAAIADLLSIPTSVYLLSRSLNLCVSDAVLIHMHNAGMPGGSKHLLCSQALLDSSHADALPKEEKPANIAAIFTASEPAIQQQKRSEVNTAALVPPSPPVANVSPVEDTYAYVGETGRRKSCPKCRHVICTCKGLKERRKMQ